MKKIKSMFIVCFLLMVLACKNQTNKTQELFFELKNFKSLQESKLPFVKNEGYKRSFLNIQHIGNIEIQYGMPKVFASYYSTCIVREYTQYFKDLSKEKQYTVLKKSIENFKCKE